MGVAEVAQHFGVTKSAVGKWIERRRVLPAPVAVLQMGPVWDTDEILAISYTNPKKKGG